jgi:hypothetical protein
MASATLSRRVGKGGRLPAALRNERSPASRVLGGAARRRQLRRTCSGPGAIQRAESMSRRLPREVRRELGLAFAAGSGGCWLVGAPHSRGPGLAAPDRAAGRGLAFAPGTRGRRASAPGSGGSGHAACPGSPAASDGGSRPTVPRSHLASAAHTPCIADSGRPSAIPAELHRRLSRPHFVQRFKSSEADVEARVVPHDHSGGHVMPTAHWNCDTRQSCGPDAAPLHG